MTSRLDDELDRIADVVAARIRAQIGSGIATAHNNDCTSDVQCSADGSCTSCGHCVSKRPEDVRAMVDSGAARVSASAGTTQVASDLAGMIDHTLLKPEASSDEVVGLCAEASELGVAAVCVSPTRVALVAELTSTHGGWVPCAVVGFPSGAHLPSVKEAEARRAVADGAAELDVVVNLGAVVDGAWGMVGEELSLVRRAIPAGTLKVILETAALDPRQVEAVARVALDAGADFLKTSTGVHPAGGATVEAVEMLVAIAAGRAKVKASGGIRDLDTALDMIAAGADRLGTSASAAILAGLD